MPVLYPKLNLLSIILFGFLLLNNLNGFCQEARKDTQFLYRQFSENGYHAFYIKKKNSDRNVVNELSKYINIDSSLYNETIRNFRGSGKTVVFFRKLNFSRQWYSLHVYKGKEYAYVASEPFFNTYVRLSDSTITMNYFNDGCLPALLTNVKWLNGCTLKLNTISQYPEDSLIIFHFLNTSKNTAIVEFPLREQSRRYILMSSSGNIRNYPTIVNYSPAFRSSEWPFDKINYKSMLKQNKCK